jgi:hypothetical protein
MANLNYSPVQSSNLRAMAYDEATQTLGVIFHNGGEYHYADVPKTVVSDMLSAPSTGQFFSRNIKGVFVTTKIGG